MSGWMDVADIFDEVNEDLRAERAKAFLARYGMLLLAAMLLAVLGTAAWQGWRWYRSKQDMAYASRFIAAMNAAEGGGLARTAPHPEALAQFGALAADAPEGYATLARLREAALKANAGDMPGAVALWNQVASDGAADPLLRDLAVLTLVQRQVGTGDPAALEARIAPLAQPDNPWHALAMEQQALLFMRTNRPAEAIEVLRRIAAETTAPQGVRARAGGLLERLGGAAS